MSMRMLAAPAAIVLAAGISAGDSYAGGTPAINCGLKGNSTCTAPTLGGGGGLRKDNKLFAGINWNFGKSSAELVVGFRHLRAQSNKDVEGAKMDFTMPFSGSGIGFDKLRLRYVNGTRDVQGEVGGGFSFQSGKPLLAAEVQGPYVLGGLDFLVGGGFQPYLGINSLARPKLPAGTSRTCLTGTETAATAVTELDAAAVVDGVTCVEPLPVNF